MRLDDFYDGSRLDFLKIDVEGMEAEVLRGAEGLIRRHLPIVYVENDRKEKSSELAGLLRSLGYRLHRHQPPLYSAANWSASRADLFPGIVSINMLCIHESRLAADAPGPARLEG